MATFWVTKYALTQGIFSIEGELNHTPDGPIYVSTRGETRYWLKLGVDVFELESDAKNDGLKQAQKKLKSLDKERAKVSAWLTKYEVH